MYYRFDGKEPVINEGSYVSETAIVIGDVVIGRNCYVGHGAILRGDYGAIRIGDGCVIEEGVIIHAPPEEFCKIGKGVILGHGAIVHAASIGDYAGAGMGAVLSLRSEISKESFAAEGAVVKQGQQVPGSIIIAGNPAKKVRDVSQKDRDFWDYTRKLYGDLAHQYLAIGMQKVEMP